MASETTVPVVLFGRYTTVHGNGSFSTQAINAMSYETIEIHVWRGDMVPSTTFLFYIEESTDQQTWTTLTSGDPGAETESLYTGDLTRPWLRARVALTPAPSGDPVTATLYAVGTLSKRGR